MNKETRLKVFDKYNGKCAYCGCDLAYKDMQVDHIFPKYRGGKDELENYNPACRACNYYKATFTVDELRIPISKIAENLKKSPMVRLALKFKIIEFKTWDKKFYFEKVEK